MKTIDQNTTVLELCTKYPELIDILVDIGFRDLANPLMRSTMGKFMTLPKGSKAKGIAWDVIVSTLKDNGFEVL